MRLFTKSDTLDYLIKFGILGAAYALTAHFSLFLVPGNGASLVWPPAALGLAVLYFWGYELWPAITAAFFALLLARGIDPPTAAAVAVANTLETLAGVYIIRYFNLDAMLGRMRDMLVLMLAAFSATLVSATVITAGVSIFMGMPFNSQLWMGIWIGRSVSLLSFGAFALRWLRRPIFTKTRQELLEGVIVFGLIAGITFSLTWTPYGQLGPISLVYVLIFPLIWASLRTGPRGTSLALFLIAIISATGIFFGSEPFSHSERALFSIQVLTGTLSVIFLLFTSITEERKEALQNLRGHVGQLENALEKIRNEDQAKSDFLAILAHELRNPLAPVLSGLELMKLREQGSPEVMHMMGAHLNTLARLLDDLLDITRISQKRFKLQKEPVKLQAIINHSLEMVKPQIDARQHVLAVSMPAPDLWMSGDPLRLAQIFVNLLTNASKYTEPGGRIELRVTREGDDAVIRVKDNGIGIPSDRIGKIFEPFGTSEGTERKNTGLRIGLSLAQRMVQMHHGSIRPFSGGEGKGSEFTVRLPLQPVQLPLDGEAPSHKRPPRARFSKQAVQQSAAQVGAIKILVVDDNEAAAQGIAALLGHAGHTAHLAYTGNSAIEETRRLKPDVVLLDIGLPDKDGYEVAKILRAEMGTSFTLVALTGYGQGEDRQKAREAGFDQHLVKPVSIVDIERTLAELRTSAKKQ